MTSPIQFHSRVGKDGILSIRVPLGTVEADSEVVVTVQPTSGRKGADYASSDWHEFVEKTYGSCADLGLEEPEDLPVQQRDWTE